MRKTTYLLAALVASACNATNSGEGARSTSAPGPSPTTSGEAAEATVEASMRGHDKLGDAMREAIVRGDLEGAKGDGKALAEMRPIGPPRGLFRALLDAMQAAAAHVSSANDAEQAGRDIGVVARTCGDCHTVFGRPGVILERPLAPEAGVRATMQRHQWAAQQLWEGLVVPSDDAWNAGALAMGEAPLAPEALTPGKAPVPGIGQLIQTVHDLGREATTADRVEVRAHLYGQMLATCADCHQRIGRGPTPAATNPPAP